MSQTSSTSVQRSAGNGSHGAIKLSARGLTNQKLVVKESRRAQRTARWISHWPTGGPFGAGLALLISNCTAKAALHR